jgi:membrane-bound lytic murein transglycosylase B
MYTMILPLRQLAGACLLSLIAVNLSAVVAATKQTTERAPLPAASTVHKASKSHSAQKTRSTGTTARARHKTHPQNAGDGEPEFTNFGQWKAVSEFITEMSDEHGFDRSELNTQFAKIHYLDKVIKLINPPPAGKTKNWTAYRERFVEPRRIQAGLDFWQRHETDLARAQAEFGVPPEIIVGVLGVETIYGRQPGNIRVMDSLTTLAFAYPEAPNRQARMAYFRSELKQALLYARESNIDPFSLSGSFAGAIGLPQFMPGSIRRYAIDFDGDGKIDLRNSAADAIGSIASFLSQHGWMANLPLVYPVRPDESSETIWKPLIGVTLAATHSVDEIEQSGVTLPSDVPRTLMVGLVDLQDGDRPTRYWVGSDNFFAITKYNRSYFYAMAVIELGNAIRQQRRS